MLHRLHFRNTIYDGPVPDESHALENEGYCLIPGLLTPDETAELRADILEVYAKVPADPRAGSENADIANMYRYEMFNRSALCQQVIGHPRTLSVVEPLLGPDCHVISCTTWRNPPYPDLRPNGQEWHTDAGPHIARKPGVPWPDDIPYPVFAIATHLFLEDCELTDGPTAFLRSSHKSGLAPPKEDEWALELEFDGVRSEPCLAQAGDMAMFVSDVWHRRLPPTEQSTGRFFLQTNYARRSLAQLVRPTSEVNHTSADARARAATERQRQLIGLHPERFYDG